MDLPLIVIVGAPNVGKSTLFNRLVGGRPAIVTDEPGMTRDRLYGVVADVPQPFRLVDTGGLTPGVDVPFARGIEGQAEAALAEAAGILFVIDARSGATALDADLGAMLRRKGRPLLLVANKVDGDAIEAGLGALHELGLGAALPVSAEHGRGINELLDAVDAVLREAAPSEGVQPGDEGTLSVAIVGRPNVGKSSLLNRLVGEERVLVSEVPGTTRDSIDTRLELGRRSYRLIDTAGIRRAGRVQHGAERFSVQRARQNIERCDVAVMVLDATESLAAQDAHIAGYIREAFKPMVVAVNKWDLVEGREEAVKTWEETIRRRLRFVKEVPIVFVSAVTGQRLVKILDLVDEAWGQAGVQVPTTLFNRWLQEQDYAVADGPPLKTGFRLFYGTQIGVHPPRFVLFCNDPRRAHFSVRRRLENSLRERFGFGSAPIRLSLRGRRKVSGS